MKEEYSFSGSTAGTSIVILEDDKITIRRKGICSFFNYGLKGEKTIQISSITGTQYKPCSFTNGYLQFVVMGSQENKGGLSAAQKDENTICWAHKKCNKYAEKIVKHIEQSNLNRNKNNSNIYNISKQDDKYDKLAKIKKLLDDGVLSQEEFEQEKRKILQ